MPPATYHTDRHHRHNGKTSAKEAAAAVLSRRAPTLKTYASYNTEIGYPITLCAWKSNIVTPCWRWARSGSENCAGCARLLPRRTGRLSLTWARRTWAILARRNGWRRKKRTGAGSLRAVIAILNYDDENVRAMSAKTRARVLFYGLNEDAAVRRARSAATRCAGDASR